MCSSLSSCRARKTLGSGRDHSDPQCVTGVHIVGYVETAGGAWVQHISPFLMFGSVSEVDATFCRVRL